MRMANKLVLLFAVALFIASATADTKALAAPKSYCKITMKEASDKLVFNVTNVFAPNGTYLVRTWALLVDPNNTETPVNEWTSKVITTNLTGKSITTSYSVNKTQAQAGRRGQVCSMGPGGCVRFYCKYLIFENDIYDEPSDATTYHHDWELFVKQRDDVSASMNISLSDYSVLAPLAT